MRAKKLLRGVTMQLHGSTRTRKLHHCWMGVKFARKRNYKGNENIQINPMTLA